MGAFPEPGQDGRIHLMAELPQLGRHFAPAPATHPCRVHQDERRHDRLRSDRSLRPGFNHLAIRLVRTLRNPARQPPSRPRRYARATVAHTRPPQRSTRRRLPARSIHACGRTGATPCAGAAAWFGSSPSTPSRSRPEQTGQMPVIRPLLSRALLIRAGSPPVPVQLPAGTLIRPRTQPGE